MNTKLLRCSLLALLAFPTLVACGKGGYKEKRTEEELVNELANLALAEIGVSFSKYSDEGVPLGDNQLMTTINEKVYEGDQYGLNFSITYAIDPMEEYDNEFLKLDDKGVLTAELVTDAEIDGFDIAKALGGPAYELEAKITFLGYAEGFKVSGLKTTNKFVDKEIASKEWNALVKTTKMGTIAEVKSAKTDEMVLTMGRVTAAYNWTYEEVFRGVMIADGEDGALLYAGNLQSVFYDSESSDMKIHIGDVVKVYGLVSPYNGLFEIKPTTISIVTDQATKDSIAPASAKLFSGTDFKNAKSAETGGLVRMENLRVTSTAIELNNLEVGTHWVIKAKTTDDIEVQIGVNYHVGSTQQEAIRTLLLNAKGGSKTFNITCMLAYSNKPELAPVQIGEAVASACFEINA